ncbi:MAG TPA: HAD-IC family P-type ATPase, partial [Tepidisphaeraceae bacterium]|nr:HAD-IC family P-type ATPase [Tepidisphaeraceae bacterium]
MAPVDTETPTVGGVRHAFDAQLSGEARRSPGARAEIALAVNGMRGRRGARAVEAALGALPGVSAYASAAAGTVHVSFDRGHCAVAELVRELEKVGVRITGPAAAAGGSRRSSPGVLGRFARTVRAYPELGWGLLGGVLLVAAWAVHAAGGPQAVRLPLVIGSMVLCGWGTLVDTVKVLSRFKFDIDVLMFAAAIGATVLGEWEEGALLLFLFAMGGAGELMAMDKARRAIAALAKLAPETAIVRGADGAERLVRVEALVVGDRVVVRPFDRVPADGVVESGTSGVDQSPITGESVPAEKAPGDAVFAGTINGEGLLVARVTKLAGESTLAKIVTMVNEAQASKSPTQMFAERVERWYVPGVLVGTAAVMVLPVVLGGGAWATWFYRSMAFLTAASPCALAIGTPAAVLSGIARAARLGVLVKGGAHLENLGRVGAVAMDKTGTLTRGRPEVTDVVVMAGYDERDVMGLAAAVERASSHPLAKAVVTAARARGAAEHGA